MRIFTEAPAVVGHRGAGELIVSGLPENTIESCRQARAQGADWVELDARLTRDGVLVLHHDGVLPDGRAIDEVTADEARRAGVEGFDDVLAELPADLGVDLEVKVALRDATPVAGDSTAGRVAARVLELAPSRPLVLTSFNPAALLQAREIAGDALPVGIIGMPITPLRELVPTAVALGARVIAPHVIMAGLQPVPGVPVDSPARVAEALEVAHRGGLEVLVWGVGPDHVPGLLELGVDAVCVDEVAATVAALPRSA